MEKKAKVGEVPGDCYMTLILTYNLSELNYQSTPICKAG